ncbi:acyl-homoserine-lactone synthase [Burkholderia gladioli]|uniref:Acyl-homoserine-lactone synthase n=1 Tax=Burkholderia gladioli (strain BSR3) TaxID=999541 RepID=F2LRS1_BURGS|nr:acyl-homoserine-lactone synthase [Burkholderia gladioli]AEA65565.1 autoinducer synthesis protein [Burkholderia gladioli BSR3]MBW5286692.1 N-acylhomoserine lactone synthase [Burkholderia gladioli]
MLHFSSGTGAELSSEVMYRLAEYRHAVFIRKLGWPLPSDDELESDSFDHADTLYVVAHDCSGAVSGCARLLPTNAPYLLGEIFPRLMGDAALPCEPDVWELSRFAISVPSGQAISAAQAWENTRSLMAEIVRVAMARGALKLIAFSVLGNERLLRRMGVNVQRAAPPQMIDDRPTLPFWIQIDRQTLEALDIELAPSWRPRAARHAGMVPQRGAFERLG